VLSHSFGMFRVRGNEGRYIKRCWCPGAGYANSINSMTCAKVGQSSSHMINIFSGASVPLAERIEPDAATLMSQPSVRGRP
jgi:hypothetical protein